MIPCPIHFSLLAPAARLGMSPSEQALSEMGLQGSTKLWIGKDYTNFIHKDFVKLDDPFTGMILLYAYEQKTVYL